MFQKTAFLLVLSFYCLVAQSQKPSITSVYKRPQQLNDGVSTATLQKVRIDDKMIHAMTDSIFNGTYPNIHSVLIMRDNKLVYENYFSGNDETRGVGYAGFKQHHRDSLHDLRSVTKSLVGTAILIAIAQGKIKSVDQRVFDFFPEHGRYDTGMKRDITVSHLMNMTAGLAWDEETISYADSTNSERLMNNSEDAIDFVLRQPMINSPGKQYIYSGGATQLLVGIVYRATGMQIDKFIEEYLFKPLSIKTFTWVKNQDGEPSGASGLRMRSRDMVKIGAVYLNEGRWKGKQIIPAHLVEETLKSQISTPYKDSVAPHIGYSNQFWIPTEMIEGKPITWTQAQGNGGQIIVIDKQNDLVAVITAGNYNLSNLPKSSWGIYPTFIYPAVIKKSKKV